MIVYELKFKILFVSQKTELILQALPVLFSKQGPIKLGLGILSPILRSFSGPPYSHER